MSRQRWTWMRWVLAVALSVSGARVSALTSEAHALHVARFFTAATAASMTMTMTTTARQLDTSKELVVKPTTVDDRVHAGKEDEDHDLLTWAAKRRSPTASSTDHHRPPHHACVDCFLIVGVKSRAVHGFHTRQFIRTAWANPAITFPLRTRVVFLGCEPDLTQESDPNVTATNHALALEKEMFGDLLTHELGGCLDSYFRLVDKALGFFSWVTQQHPSASFVMVADDDVYIRLARLVTMLRDEATPRVRYYAGQVSSVQSRSLVLAIRKPWHKNYLSVEEYPLSEHAPRAIGAHFLLSTDLVKFLSRNRQALRGVGTIEDLSIGFWLLALLRVHPVHLPLFETTLCAICRNALVSYGDLSPNAIRHIHQNLQRGDAFCRGFTWAEWSPPHTKDPVGPQLRPRSDIVYDWAFQIQPSTRRLRIEVSIQLTGLLTPITLPPIVYTPSLEDYHNFCLKLTQRVTRFQPRLPLTLCDDFFARLDEYLIRHPPTTTAQLALTRSNLPPLAGRFVAINVWVSNRVSQWRLLMECLFAGLYPNIHVYVLDETTAPIPTIVFDTDFAVISTDELARLPDVPPSCRFLVIATEQPTRDVVASQQIQQLQERHGAILLTRDRPIHDPTVVSPPQQMYIPLASLIFSDSLTHSPLALLQASSKRRLDFSPVASFTVPHCNMRAKALLVQLQDVQALADCSTDTNRMEDIVHSAPSSSPLFALDEDVAQYSHSKFVLAFESEQSRPGYVAGTIVAAFLAGCIPIYDGDDATVSRLFNQQAFIRCSHFASLQECAAYVLSVHDSVSIYESMRKVPPVINATAFYEVFSWHPDVLLRLEETEPNDTARRFNVVDRLQELIGSM